MANIEDLLTKWKLEHLLDKFHDENITLETLKILQPHHIKKLFSTLRTGDQAIFEYELTNWKRPFKNEQIELVQKNLHCSEDLSKNKLPTVSHILNDTKTGLNILKFYEKNKFLQEEHRTLLINTITKYLEFNGSQCSLSDCAAIEKQICSLFPSEDLSFYTNGKRGKIYNKLANLKRTSKEIFKTQEPEEECEDEQSEDYTIIVQMLRSDKVSADDFDIFWRKCSAFRFRQIENSKSTSEVFDLWPEYTKPSAAQLIGIDFSLKYPTAKRVKDTWSQFENKLFNIIKAKSVCSFTFKELEKTETSDEESKMFGILWHCHKLFPPQQTSKTFPSGEKVRKRFSVSDSQESFALLAASNEEMETKLKLLHLQGRNIQPKLLVIGEIFNIQKVFVYFDKLRFPALRILEGFDLLFKIFFVFNIKFPQESEVFYSFVQSVLYNIDTSKKYTKVSSIKHELLNT